jgi:ribosomal protein S18 acetylase RimI-like enzyme
MEYRITNEFPESKLDHVISTALAPRLWVPRGSYPDEFDWAEKAYEESRIGVKRHMVLFDHEQIVGTVIYQRHKTEPHVLEIKRFSIEPSARGRDLASALLTNTEIEGMREFGTTVVRGDSKMKSGINGFLIRKGYRRIGIDDLYALGAGEDNVWEKPLGPRLLQG